MLRDPFHRRVIRVGKYISADTLLFQFTMELDHLIYRSKDITKDPHKILTGPFEFDQS